MCTFLEQTKTCPDVNGDGILDDAFDCASWGESKDSPEACVGDCADANCCGIIIMIIMFIIVYGSFVFSLDNTDTVLMTCLINMLTYAHHTTTN